MPVDAGSLGYDTGFQVVIEDKQIYPGDTYFKDVFKEDGTPWVEGQGARCKVLDSNMKVIDEVDLNPSGGNNPNGDNMALELRYKNTSDWKKGYKYRLLVYIYDESTGYSDTVLEANFKVR
jgi:hypothetical protein